VGLKPVAHVSEVIFQAEQTDVLDLAVLRTAKDGSATNGAVFALQITPRDDIQTVY